MRDLRQTGYAQQVGPAPAYGGHRVVFVFLLELRNHLCEVLPLSLVPLAVLLALPSRASSPRIHRFSEFIKF